MSFSYPIDQCQFVAEKIGTIVGTYVTWPNHFFLPGDRVAPLLGVIPGVWYDAEDPVDDVWNSFHLEGVKDGDETYYDIVLNGKFEQLFDLIIQANQFGVPGDKKSP